MRTKIVVKKTMNLEAELIEKVEKKTIKDAPTFTSKVEMGLRLLLAQE